MVKYGVDVPKLMAYRAKNLAIDDVLGEHKKQYPRLRDYSQTVMDTNPGSRVVVTTITPTPMWHPDRGPMHASPRIRPGAHQRHDTTIPGTKRLY
jgi:hypothetical protein